MGLCLSTFQTVSGKPPLHQLVGQSCSISILASVKNGAAYMYIPPGFEEFLHSLGPVYGAKLWWDGMRCLYSYMYAFVIKPALCVC